MSVCAHTWSETYKLETRRPHIHHLHHKCVVTAGHLYWDRPAPHRCACDIPPEFRSRDHPEWFTPEAMAALLPMREGR